MIVPCYLCTKTYLKGTHWDCLTETIPMSTQKICFGGNNYDTLNYCIIYKFICSNDFSFSHANSGSPAEDKQILYNSMN